jgi:hypothetical protein
MTFSSLFDRLFNTSSQCNILGLSCLLFCIFANAQVPLSKEKKLKAAYLLNFTKFIEWPVTGNETEPSTIRICVDESSDFILFFRNMIGDRRFGQRQHKVKVIRWDRASGCELLYVTGIKNIGAMGVDNIVIVADSDKIYFPNTAIVFYKKNKKLRFEMDLSHIKTLNVTFSSELLKLARIK